MAAAVFSTLRAHTALASTIEAEPDIPATSCDEQHASAKLLQLRRTTLSWGLSAEETCLSSIYKTSGRPDAQFGQRRTGPGTIS